MADGSPDAYPKNVDRLLASARYGERMGADWLDVARFADTYGYQADWECRVWPWRDWLIGAFNRNLPYDLFVRDQLAGDLVPGATDEERIATRSATGRPRGLDRRVPAEYISDRRQTYGRRS
jgi:hypothetical protein